MRQPDASQGLIGESLALLEPHAENLWQIADVLEYRPPGNQPEILKHDADRPSQVRHLLPRNRRDIAAIHQDLSSRWFDLSVYEFQQRALASPAGAAQERKVSPLQLEAHFA